MFYYYYRDNKDMPISEYSDIIEEIYYYESQLYVKSSSEIINLVRIGQEIYDEHSPQMAKEKSDIEILKEIVNQNILLSIDIDYTKSIEEIKQLAIAKTKVWISKELGKSIEFNGKMYSVTMEKQSLLSSQLGLFMMNSQLGLPMQLTWNATGEPCEIWKFEDLLMLSNAMAMHVAPLVKKQQTAEVMIKETDDIEQIKEIMLDFE